MPKMRGVVLLLSLCALCCSTAGDMVGCGGFVRSKYLNDFSKVKVYAREVEYGAAL